MVIFMKNTHYNYKTLASSQSRVSANSSDVTKQSFNPRLQKQYKQLKYPKQLDPIYWY